MSCQRLTRPQWSAKASASACGGRPPRQRLDEATVTVAVGPCQIPEQLWCLLGNAGKLDQRADPTTPEPSHETSPRATASDRETVRRQRRHSTRRSLAPINGRSWHRATVPSLWL